MQISTPLARKNTLSKCFASISLNCEWSSRTDLFEWSQFQRNQAKSFFPVHEMTHNGHRACSYDPAYRDVSLTDDLAAYLFSYKILHCVHMRKRAGPLAEISFEFAEIIGRRDENFSI